MKSTDIAIVGMSCLFPDAKNIQEFWNNLISGKNSITEAPNSKFDILVKNTTNCLTSIKGGFIPSINLDFESLNLTKSEIQNVDIDSLLAFKLVVDALEDASISRNDLSNSCVIIGKENNISSSNINAIDTFHTKEQLMQIIRNILPNLTEYQIVEIEKEYLKNRNADRIISTNIASFISNKLNINGSAYSLDSSYSSSLLALEHAIKELTSNRVEIGIVGGINFTLNSTNLGIYSKKGILNNNPNDQIFNNSGEIFLGEGAGFVILKKLDQAILDNNKIYATIQGISSNSISDIEIGQKEAIKNAWEQAQISPKDIDYIEASASSMNKEDQTEIKVLSNLFKDKKITVGTLKPNIGNTLSASGIASIIKVVLSLYNQEIPSTLNDKICNEELKDTPIIIPAQNIQNMNLMYAGINSFGLEGMNVHTIIKVHDKNSKIKSLSSVRFTDEVIAVTANSKEELIKALDEENFSIANNTGKYRLVLFNPVKERIEKAKKLISKDKPWKGRQDIWFTNKPLLNKNGKIVFLFPGFDPSSHLEIESIAPYFDLKNSYNQNLNEDDQRLLNQSFKQSYACEISDKALKDIGVLPDMNAGHSLGEWFAANAAGLFHNNTVSELLKSMDPEKYEIEGIYFIAVGAGTEKINPILENIPDLYLSNDNCPSQVLLCGTEKAKDILTKYLKSEQIFYQILTFQSGFHSPFIKDKLYLLDEALEHIKLKKNKIPVWSATTLERYSHTKKEFKELTIKHLTEPVLFRELIQKLYSQEKARIFIQVGGGSLIGFVDDILKENEYSAISTSVPNRTTLEQLRRILALLFIEGKSINIDFLGLRNSSIKNSVEINLNENLSIVKDFPTLQNLVENLQVQSSHTDIHNKIDDLLIKSNHPVIQALNDNTLEIIQMQKEFSEIIRRRNNNIYTFNNKNQAVQHLKKIETNKPLSNQTLPRKGSSFKEDLYISLEDHPYLIDHSLFKQPKYWKDLEDINPVIPMTMSLELLMETALKQAPDQKILCLGPVSVFQWMKVSKPFQQIIEGTWKSESIISLKIKNFANAEVTLGNEFYNPEPYYTKDFDLGKDLASIPTPKTIYTRHMFHGPAYQGIHEIKNITQKGLRAIIKKSSGKGSLLDNIGQLFGLYLQVTLGEESNVSFPVKIEEINFYHEFTDQEGTFECICLPTSITEKIATTDIIIKRDNKIWCIIKGWKNQIFEGFDKNLWNMTMNPSENIISKNIEGNNIYFFNNIYNRAVNWNFLMNIYLNKEEKEHYNSLMLNKKKDFLISRICLKDNVRKYISNKFGKNYYPIEISVQHDLNNKPYVQGVSEAEKIEISIAHKDSNSVSIVSDKPIGIDIELIQPREQGFLDLSFTAKELNLIKDKNLSEWSTRLWVAKEAYGKKLGLGLQGNPKKYEIENIEDNILSINKNKIKTIKLNNYIIGWTQ